MADTEKKIVNEYSLTITAERINGEKNGKKYDFLAFSGHEKNGKKCRYKFVKACENVPKEEGTYIIVVNKADINRDKSTVYNEYWIRKIKSVTDVNSVMSDNTEDLPF